MHLSAVVELEGLADRVRFWRMDQKLTTNGKDSSIHKNGKNKGTGTGTGTGTGERRALGVVEMPHSEKVAMVVGSGKVLKKVEKEIQERSVRAKKAEERRNDVSR